MKKTLVSFGLGMALVLAVPGVAVADAPHHVMVSDAACNDGTAAARVISDNGTVPMLMVTTPIGCMTMPGAFQGP